MLSTGVDRQFNLFGNGIKIQFEISDTKNVLYIPFEHFLCVFLNKLIGKLSIFFDKMEKFEFWIQWMDKSCTLENGSSNSLYVVSYRCIGWKGIVQV